MLGVGYERPPHNPEDDILQPSTSSPDLAPADRSAASALGSSYPRDCHEFGTTEQTLALVQGHASECLCLPDSLKAGHVKFVLQSKRYECSWLLFGQQQLLQQRQSLLSVQYSMSHGKDCHTTGTVPSSVVFA